MSWKAVLFVAISLTVGFAAASWTDRPPADVMTDDSGFDRSAPLEERVRALEQALSSERFARQLLQDELFYLTAELEVLTATPRSSVADEAIRSGPQAVPERLTRPARSRSQDRSTQLVLAGFSPSQAEAIAQREAELQMAALQARYDAGQGGDMSTFYRSRGAIDESLRAELGEDDYERYRTATGQSTSVAVGSVIDSSPAQRAGLQYGDRIVRYDGERVYGMSDLTRQTMEGQPGQQVMVDILRDAIPMQVVIPRGPLGISGGRRSSN